MYMYIYAHIYSICTYYVNNCEILRVFASCIKYKIQVLKVKMNNKQQQQQQKCSSAAKGSTHNILSVF